MAQQQLFQETQYGYEAKYPAAPGAKVNGPSAEAADEMRSRAGFLREAVMRELIASGPLTADECARNLGESVLAVRPRFSELLTAGRIADTGGRRANESGKRATVWGATRSVNSGTEAAG